MSKIDKNIENLTFEKFEKGYNFFMQNAREGSALYNKQSNKNSFSVVCPVKKGKELLGKAKGYVDAKLKSKESGKEKSLFDFKKEDFHIEFVEDTLKRLVEEDNLNVEAIKTFLKYQKNLLENKVNKEKLEEHYMPMKICLKEIGSLSDSLIALMMSKNSAIENFKKIEEKIEKVENSLGQINVKFLKTRLVFIKQKLLSELALNLEKEKDKKEQIFLLRLLNSSLKDIEKHIDKIKSNDLLKDDEEHNYFTDKVNEYEPTPLISLDFFLDKEQVEIFKEEETREYDSIKETKKYNDESSVVDEDNIENKQEKNPTLDKVDEIVSKARQTKVVEKTGSWLKELKMNFIHTGFLNTIIENQFYKRDPAGAFFKNFIMVLGLFYVSDYMFEDVLGFIISSLLVSVYVFEYFPPFFFVWQQELFEEFTDEDRRHYEQVYKQQYNDEIDLTNVKNGAEMIFFLKEAL